MKRVPLNVRDYKDNLLLARDIWEAWRYRIHEREELEKTWDNIQHLIQRRSVQETESNEHRSKVVVPILSMLSNSYQTLLMRILLPNEKFVKWVPANQDEDKEQIRKATRAYTRAKVTKRDVMGDTRRFSKDVVEKGNGFLKVDFISEYITGDDGIPNLVKGGPQLSSVPARNIVFDPRVSSFDDSWCIMRDYVHMGTIELMPETMPQYRQMSESLSQLKHVRNTLGTYEDSQTRKELRIQEDGLTSYFDEVRNQKSKVEVLEFRGDIWDEKHQEMHKNVQIVVWDRSFVALKESLPLADSKQVYHGHATLKSDILYASSPLENLEGMQRATDSLYNNSIDLVHFASDPPTKIRGQVEEFSFDPGEDIQLRNDGSDVTLFQVDLTAARLAADFINMNEQKMSAFSGITPELRGFRSPAEKTLGEFQGLTENATSPFFVMAEQIEIGAFEPAINDMIRLARMYGDSEDTLQYLSDVDEEAWLKINPKKDLGSAGKVRVFGARHARQRNKLLGDLVQYQQLFQAFGTIKDIDRAKFNRMLESTLEVEDWGFIKQDAALYSEAKEELKRSKARVATQEAIAQPSVMDPDA